jgi:hypothetical protein
MSGKRRNNWKFDRKDLVELAKLTRIILEIIFRHHW